MSTAYIISASVGRGGVNNPNDVIVVQILLNRIAVADGGPDPQLGADGLIGPKTQAAIDRLQQHHQLGSDGRIDPGGKMLAKINQLVKEGVPTPAPLPAIPPPPGPPSNKAANAIVMGIWGRAGAGDDADPDNGIAAGIERLRPRLTALGVPDNHIWSTSWNTWHNDNPFDLPATAQHVDELIAREANPSYVALIGHSYGGRAVCMLSRQFDRDPDYIALIDPVFGPMGDNEQVIEPRGAVIQNWYQRNAIRSITEEEDCSGTVAAGLPLGISLGRSIPNAQNFEVEFQRHADGTPVTRPQPCPDGKLAPMHITHVTIDGDEFIWGQIFNKIINDIRDLTS